MKYKGLKKFEANTKGQDWVVGDIHGMYGYLMAELDKVGFDKENDRLFGVGDLIDRGPDSAKCIRLLNEPWFFSVIGNHDAMLLEKDYIVWYNNGGKWWVHETKEVQEELKEILERHAYVAFEVAHSTGKKFGIVHADVPGFKWNEINWDNHYNVESAFWGRVKIKMAIKALANIGDPIRTENIDIVFHGHSTTKEVVKQENMVWLDTGGCWDDGFLSIVKVDEYLCADAD